MSIETKIVHRLEQTDVEIHVDKTYGTVKLFEDGAEIFDLTPTNGDSYLFMCEFQELVDAAIKSLRDMQPAAKLETADVS